MSPDTPDSPGQLATRTRQMIDSLNTHLDLCEAQQVFTTLESRKNRVHLAKIARKRQEEILYEPPGEEDGGNGDA